MVLFSAAIRRDSVSHLSLSFLVTSSSHVYCYYHYKSKIKVGDCSRGPPEGSLFNNYYNEV